MQCDMQHARWHNYGLLKKCGNSSCCLFTLFALKLDNTALAVILGRSVWIPNQLYLLLLLPLLPLLLLLLLLLQI